MLQDLFRPNLLVVFCGSAAGHRSAQLRQYYAGPGNRFWEILAVTKLTSQQLLPSQWQLLTRFGIGLTDIAKDQSGSDVRIDFQLADRDALNAKIIKYQPRILCFNGKRSAQVFFATKEIEYGRQPHRIGATEVWVVPSTSGAAGASWDRRIWHRLARRVRMLGRSLTSASS
jgi:TDG/mug DNA glycosylase family protein